MKLKDLTLKGFKSFYNTTKFEFLPGITAIVGPNGSGKSNISDAIRWVLGETSIKSLRGNKMEDVISTGSDLVKPVGFAEVSITFSDCKFDNLPYTEINVSRRIYRDGESEFFINKNKVRLKDIRDLFLDTGVGRDGYSFVGQGEIETILSTKPEDLRIMFEEASGISKYKTRKEESLRKINKARDNLVRLNDINKEISLQYEALDIESKKAIELQDIVYKKKHLELSEMKYSFQKLNSDLEKNALIYNDLKEQIEILDEKLLKNQEYKNNLDIEVQELNLEKERLNNNFIEENKISSNIKTELAVINEKIKNIEIKKDSIKEQINLNSTQIEENLVKIDEINRNINSKNIELDENIDNSIVNNDKKISELEKEYSNLKENSWKLRLELKEIEIENAKIDENNFINKNLVKEFEYKINSAEQEIKKCEEENRILLNKKGNLEEKLEFQLNILNKLSISYDEITNNRDEIYEEIKELEKNISILNAKIESEENYLDNGNLLSRMNKVLKEKFGKDFIGPVYENIKIKDNYTKAVDIAFGTKQNYFLVKNSEIVKQIIEFINLKKLGRATFLPLDVFFNTHFNSEIKKRAAVLGYVSDFIETDAEYKNAIFSLIKDIVVVDNIDAAIINRKAINKTIVTLDGELLHFSGSITGGNKISKNISSIESKNNIKLLKSEKTEKESYINNKSKLYRSIEIEIENIKKEIEKTKINLDDLKLKNRENDSKIEFNNIKLESLKNNLKDLKGEIEKKSITTEKLDIDTKQKELLVIDNAIKEFEKYKLPKIEKLKDINVKLNNEVIEYEKINLDKKLLQEKLNITSEINKELEEKNKSLYNESNNIDVEIVKLKESKEIIFNNLSKYDSLERDFNIKHNKLIDNISELNLKLKNIESETNEFILEKNNLNNEYNINSIKQAKLEENIDNIKDIINNSYDIQYDEFLKLEPVKNQNNIKKELSQLNVRILELGNVNMKAPEEFDEIRKRKEFYDSQISDVENSIYDLEDIVNEIDQDMKKKFLLSFKIIRETFRQTFESLFEGGSADIELTGNNVLESGINILAQPPGKNTKQLSLLSGGEKTLTAIALLFSFLSLNPSPFCILDEIDAALDDINISRYCNYLKKLSKNSQFLIITHRKPTLEVADTIYGITLKNKGSSSAVSIDLSSFGGENV